MRTDCPRARLLLPPRPRAESATEPRTTHTYTSLRDASVTVLAQAVWSAHRWFTRPSASGEFATPIPARKRPTGAVAGAEAEAMARQNIASRRRCAETQWRGCARERADAARSLHEGRTFDARTPNGLSQERYAPERGRGGAVHDLLPSAKTRVHGRSPHVELRVGFLHFGMRVLSQDYMPPSYPTSRERASQTLHPALAPGLGGSGRRRPRPGRASGPAARELGRRSASGAEHTKERGACPATKGLERRVNDHLEGENGSDPTKAK
jgi:hypothetical protein